MSAFPYSTTSLCKDCKLSIPAVVVQRGHEVWMEKTCAVHGDQTVRLSTDAGWYGETRATKHDYVAPGAFPHAVERGCPYDCGACEEHVARTRLPVITITSACNLDCPICYVHNKNEGAYHMSLADFRSTLAALRREQAVLDIVNLTGGGAHLASAALRDARHRKRRGRAPRDGLLQRHSDRERPRIRGGAREARRARGALV